MSSAWIILLFAGLLEICWAIGLKYTEGFTRLYPSIFTLVTLAGSMYLLAKAAQTLPIGTAYAVWVGIGAIGAGILGIFLSFQGTSHTSSDFVHDFTGRLDHWPESYGVGLGAFAILPDRVHSQSYEGIASCSRHCNRTCSAVRFSPVSPQTNF